MTALDDEMQPAREEMVREIARLAEQLAPLGRVELSPRVLDVMREVPRHLFLPAEHLADAYRNRPVPIGYGQTISQPFIVALMTDLLDLTPEAQVLEVGTGAGYQAAILAGLAAEVFTVEVVAPLAERARQTFAQLGLSNITARTGDGNEGWPEAAPFDAILVAAAAPDIPPALIAQLAPGGRLVVPVGQAGGGGVQQLILVEMARDQSVTLKEIIPVSFVPLTKGDGGEPA